MKSILTEKWLVCRICLKQPKEKMQSIFNSNAEKDLTRMILECGGVPIKQFDHYPDKICNICYDHLQVAHKFRTTCQRSHNQLSRFIAPVVIEKSDYSLGFVETVDAEFALAAPETCNISDTATVIPITNKVDNIKIENTSSTTEQFTLQEMAESEYYDDLVEFYEPANEEVEVATNTEGKVLVADLQELDQGEVEYLDLENEVEIVTSDEDYKPPQSVAASVKKRPRGRPSKKSLLAGSNSFENKNSKRLKRSNKEGKGKVASFICDFCGNKYPTQGRLTEHIKLHKGIKPHECEICGHAFSQTQQLTRHMNTHTGNRPYKCSYCPAAFADLSTRNKHHRIHTNERPYGCDVCGKTFTYTNTLKFHKMIHTGEKPFVCDECGKGFQQAYKLRSHKQTHEKHKYIKAETIDMSSMMENSNLTIATGVEIADENSYDQMA